MLTADDIVVGYVTKKSGKELLKLTHTPTRLFVVATYNQMRLDPEDCYDILAVNLERSVVEYLN